MVDTATIISWVIIAGGSFALELMMPQFYLLWFGIGAVAALAAHFLGVAYGFQWILFVVISGLGLFLTRHFAGAVLTGETKKSVVYELIGQTMKVTRRVDNIEGNGQVQAGGDLWRAISEDGSVLEVGALAKAIRVEGTAIVVRLNESAT